MFKLTVSASVVVGASGCCSSSESTLKFSKKDFYYYTGLSCLKFGFGFEKCRLGCTHN